jgi:serine/threonine-protein kinase RsbW
MAMVFLPHAPASAAVARHRLVEGLSALGIRQDVIADAELVITEMVGNAVRHARPLPDGQLRAGWELEDECVVLHVTDGGGATRPVVTRQPDFEAERGRGLAIVAALAQDWGSERDDRGLQIWAALNLAC